MYRANRCKHREPDGVDRQLRVRVSVEDVRADPTGPERADASGRGDEQDQAGLAGTLVEQRAQLTQVAQVHELAGTGRAVACTTACSEQREHDSERRGGVHCPTNLAGTGRRRCQRPAPRASTTIARATARTKAPCPPAKLRALPEKRTPKLTIGS